jgi:hypothetical protein
MDSIESQRPSSPARSARSAAAIGASGEIGGGVWYKGQQKLVMQADLIRKKDFD